MAHAESLPFADASLGAVTFGQAWHWVDVPTASAEVARVLRPGGVLGLIWNIRDESVDWVAALGAAMGSSKAESMVRRTRMSWWTHRSESWSSARGAGKYPMTPEGIRSMVRSRSYYIAGDGSRARTIDAAVNDVLAEFSGTGTLSMPYVTHAFRATAP